MIIVSGIFDVADDQRDAFLESKREQVLRTRGETGCREYAFSADAHTPGRVRLFELWDSFPDLEAHLAGIRSSNDPGPSIPVESSVIQVYEADPTTPPWARTSGSTELPAPPRSVPFHPCPWGQTR